MCNYCKRSERITGDSSFYIYVDLQSRDINLMVDGTLYDFATISYCPMCGQFLDDAGKPETADA